MPSFLDQTFERMLREQLPNLFRLYVNPFVAQACLCLSRYVETTWPDGGTEHQSFLANSFDEALSGAIKLARFDGSAAGRSPTGLIIDPNGRLGPFVSTPVADGRIEFVPGLVVAGAESAPAGPFGFVVLIGAGGDLERHAETVRAAVRQGALLITCVDRPALAAMRRSSTGLLRELTPDVVVFDESFAGNEVPFGAFTAKKTLYDHWNKPARSTFHSTTFQPNTLSSLHFVRCLERDDPGTFLSLREDLARAEVDLTYRGKLFRGLYSPSLHKAARLLGCETADVRAAGAYVHVDGRAIFDCVSGVACSVRGHNPSEYVRELAALPGAAEVEAELTARLSALTGLGNVLPAVSGASAIESALKMALVAQHPRRHVLALESGFGGKTLFALTGTAKPVYKDNVGPLYPDVTYVDPFSPGATARLEEALNRHPVAVVQAELVQGVGGVRRVPDEVLRFLQEGRKRWGYLLLIDEVQTGTFRTGPFARSTALGLTPDLLVVGKGVSDMMFPFSLLLYSDAVAARLREVGSGLPEQLRRRCGHEGGYRTVLNVLRYADKTRLADRVTASGEMVARWLGEEVKGCAWVRDVRVFGLLLGIELDATRLPRRWFRKRLFQYYLYNALRHPDFPVFIGFCQYEPNVLKITPPLNSTEEELRRMCSTIGEVLRRPFYRLVASVVGGLVRSAIGGRRKKHEHARSSA